MVPNIDPAVISTIAQALLFRRDGCALSDIVSAFPTEQSPHKVQSWINQLVDAGIIDARPSGRVHRYFLTDAAAPYVGVEAGARGVRSEVMPPETKGQRPAVQGDLGPETRDQGPTDQPSATGASRPQEPATPLATSPGGDAAPVAPPAMANPAANGAPGAGACSADPAANAAGNGTANGITAAATDVAKSAADGPRTIKTRDERPETKDQGSTEESNRCEPSQTESIRQSNATGASRPQGSTNPGAPAPIENRDSKMENFAALFESALPQIVLSVLPRASATAFLQVHASQNLAAGDRQRFVTYAMDRLSRLSMGECIRHGLQPAQFELWRHQYSPAATNATGADTPAAPSATSAAAGTGTVTPPSSTAGAAVEGTATSGANAAGKQCPGHSPEALPEAVLTARPIAADGSLTTSSVNAFATALADAIGRWMPRGMDPRLRLPLAVAVAVSVFYLFKSFGSSPWLSIGAPILLLIGASLLQPPRPASDDPKTDGNAGRKGTDRDPNAGSNSDLKPQLSGSKSEANPGRNAVAGDIGSGTAMDTAGALHSGTNAGPDTAVPTQRLRHWGAIVMAALVAVAAGGIGIGLYRRSAATPAMSRPPEDAVRAHLVKNAGPLPVRLADLRVTYGNATATTCRLTYEARFETTEPLFRRIDTTEYLRTHAGTELAAIEAAAALLRGSDGAQISARIADQGPAAYGDQGPKTRDPGPEAQPNATGASRPQDAANPQSEIRTPQLHGVFPPVLVTTATPPGTSVAASGTLVAWKHGTTWIFTGDPVRLDRAALAGDPKPAGALAVDVPEDAAQLQALIADRVADAAKVQAAAKAAAAQRERDVQARKAAFAGWLRGGTLFTGVVNDPTKHQPQRFVLEITAANGSRLTAVLRNEGGWVDVRPFQGEWTIGGDSVQPVSGPNAAGYGDPALQTDGQVATVTLRTTGATAIDGAGPLLQDRIDWALSFSVRADGSAVAAPPLASSLSPLASAVVAATAVQRVDPAAVADLKAAWTRGLAAVLTATRAGAVYRGTALSKIYRTTETLWLRFGDVGRDRPIPPSNGTQARRDTAIPPYIDPAQPIIVDATVAAAANGGGRAFRGTIVANTYRAGGNPIRLLSADADRITGAKEHSMLSAVTGAGLSIVLRLDADRLVGEDGLYVYTFAPDSGANAGGATTAEGPGTRDQGPGTADATGASRPQGAGNPPSAVRPPDLPLFPAAVGAYGLVGGRWVALPTNHAQAIEKAKRPLDGFFSALEDWERKIAGQPQQPGDQIWGALMYDGQADVPWLPASGVVICYVGELKPIPPARLKKYPTLALEPLMELGRLQTLSDQSRSILVTAVYPGIPGFGPRRIEATVEQRPPHVVLLRCAGPLVAGRYAVTCNEQAFELGVVAEGVMSR